MRDKPLENRRDLSDFLTGHMAITYESLKEKQELNKSQNLLKTYIIESNIDDPNSLSDQLGKDNLKIKTIEKDKLYSLTLLKKGFSPKDEIYLDKKDSRYWVIYSILKAEKSDNFISNLLSPAFNKLDNLWLNGKYLQNFSNKYGNVVRKVGVRSSYGKYFESDDDDDDGLSLKIGGKNSFNYLDEIRSNTKLTSMLAVSTVGFKKYISLNETLDDSKNHPHFGSLIEDINYSGRFSVKGDSFEEHNRDVDQVISDYSQKLCLIEDKFAFNHYKDDNGFGVTGKPFTFSFKKGIEDLEHFTNILFSGKKPFNVSGFVDKISKGHYAVAALDLHNGDKIDLEITNDWIRLYLPKGACGNTVMRFFVNLEQSYDSEVKLEVNEYGSII